MRALLTLFVLSWAACATDVAPPTIGPSLPSALLTCPAVADAGAPFVVDGSSSRDPDGPFAEVTLRVLPGDLVLHDLSGTFVVAASGVATASLAVVDGEGNRAEARCRINVRGAGGGDDDAGWPSDPGGPVDLTGDFALVAYDRPELSGAILDPARQCSAAADVGIVHLEQTGTRVTMTMRTCAVDLPSVKVWFSDVQRSSVPVPALEAFPVVGPLQWDLERAEIGASFAPPLAELGVAQVVGATLDDPDAALPTDAADARVTDDDLDGDPGVTIESNFGPQLVVVRRAIRAMSGVITSSDEVDGASEGSWRVDSDSSLLSLLDFLVPTGVGLPSTFGMVRVDGANDALDLRGSDGVLDCGDLRAAKELLEQRVPAPAMPADCATF